ncbi:uncharacterized protein C8R40DRAFT_1158730 [Lentinula edodes]|uniref:uncharacterized protein n=1 Tax=Lentinula edodes TaxID=5353 RepID=UPI001E8E9FAF|nr:uncharacterized protein C8R40DRAFT_1158730 [Lentinula edodes]KAH7879361.1 hypothetical protein C8R40DRAFT_1158730 [Lentinula edodes]
MLAKDNNFCFPIPDILATEKLELVPFAVETFPVIPSRYIPPYATDLIQGLDESSWIHIPVGPYSSPDGFVEKFWNECIRPNHGSYLFVALNKPSTTNSGEVIKPTVAGMADYMNTDTKNLCTEILGLRRVGWSVNVTNTASIRLAMKMGMKVEGVQNWTAVLPMNKMEAGDGRALQKGDPQAEFPGRDNTLLAICWDDWDKEGKKNVENILT